MQSSSWLQARLSIATGNSGMGRVRRTYSRKLKVSAERSSRALDFPIVSSRIGRRGGMRRTRRLAGRRLTSIIMGRDMADLGVLADAGRDTLVETGNRRKAALSAKPTGSTNGRATPGCPGDVGAHMVGLAYRPPSASDP